MPKTIKLLLAFFLISLGYIAVSGVSAQAAGQYSFTPPSGTFYVGRQFETEIKITTDQPTTAADIQISFDSCKLEVQDAYTGVSGVQIYPGNVFPTYPNIGNTVTTAGCNGLIKLTGFTADSSGVLQGGGSGVFGKIRFKVLDVNLTGSIADIVTTGFGPTFTLDSNISDTNGVDMLSGATDGSFILREDNNPVPDSDDRPYFDTLDPASNATGVSRSSDIKLRANDNESGVDIATFSAQIIVNGAPTTYNSSQISKSCTTTNLDAVSTCDITINPATDFPYDSQVCVTPTIRDLARKAVTLVDISHTSASLTYCFRTEFDLGKPYTTSNLPAKNSTGVATNSPFSFTLKDDGTGVDIGSLIVSIDSVDYPYTSTGSGSSYDITVSNLPTLNQNQTYTVRIRAKDTATQNGTPTPNQLDETYTFKTADTNKPFVDGQNPSANGNLTNLCDSLTLHVKDTGSGVDINTLRVIVSATGEYTKTGSRTFGFVGSPDDYTITITPPTGCWPANLPLAVGVFARDNDGNYLDADIYAIANGGTNIVYQTITDTIIREVPVTQTQIQEIIKTIPSNLSTKEIITILGDKLGFPIDENLISKADANIAARTQELIGNSVNVKVIKVNNQESTDKAYWIFEGTGLDINGIGAPGETLWVELVDGNVGVQVTVGDDGNWKTNLPGTYKGLNTYQVTSRPIIDGKLAGNRTPVGKITVIPGWWITAGVIGILLTAVYWRQWAVNRGLLAKVKELSNLTR
jgi:hypothetical protein